MNIKLTIYLIVLSFLSAFANDSAISSYGGVIVPLKETNIALKKEILEFNEFGLDLFASVYFEFYNPGEETKLEVGFISPPIKNWRKEIEPLSISAFRVSVNGIDTKYSISQLDSTDLNFPEHHVFKFNVIFEPGINKIRHSYVFEYIRDSSGWKSFYYILKSGLFWANSEIEDFKLIVNLGNNLSYEIPYNFGIAEQRVFWRIEGEGKIDSTDQNTSNSIRRQTNPCLFAFIKKGKLIFEKKHFKPTGNIGIDIYDPVQRMKEIQIVYWNDVSSENMTYLSDEDIRIARNTLFAKYGYKFKSKDLLNYFSKYFWYMPDESVPNDLNILKENEKKLFIKIQELQKYRENENTK